MIIRPATDTLIINSYGLMCHRASCMQANDAEGRKNDRLGKERRRERRKGLTRANTAIYSNKGGLLPKP